MPLRAGAGRDRERPGDNAGQDAGGQDAPGAHRGGAGGRTGADQRVAMAAPVHTITVPAPRCSSRVARGVDSMWRARAAITA